jgi:hypothetical protein
MRLDETLDGIFDHFIRVIDKSLHFAPIEGER